ncbi:MAG: hypothetical protein HQM08_10825 [Candidatus Riflebacteria bacterium]|nr:hypothetical protein [Candidatus Riflebacteria bacterium]
MKWFFGVIVLFLFAIFPLFADCTSDQWKIDLALYQQHLNSTPKDYVGAININRKWIQYTQKDPSKVNGIAGEMGSINALQSNLDNIYREVAQVLSTDYDSLIKNDPLKAAQLGLDLVKFFSENSDVARGYASANGISSLDLKITLFKSIRTGFEKNYQSMALQYSALIKAGKNDEAEKLAQQWKTVIADMDAHGNPLPQEFRDFTGVSVESLVNDVSAWQEDVKKYNVAVASGDFANAFDLINKWEKFAEKNPRMANSMNFVFNASQGVKQGEKQDFKKIFTDIKVDTYVAMFNYDKSAYENLIAAGKIDDAKKLLDKWQTEFGSELGDSIATKLGFNLQQIKDDLAKKKAELDAVDPALSTENVASFKKDLDEYYKCRAMVASGTPVGSDEWYSNLARGLELADKWSKTAVQNPDLAAQVKKATGIDLPKDSNSVIGQGLDIALNDSAATFNKCLGSGEYAKARDIVKNWRKYLDEHTRVQEIAVEKWGQNFLTNLENYENGLNTMSGNGATAVQNSVTSTGTDTTTGTSVPVNTNANQTGLGPSAQ